MSVKHLEYLTINDSKILVVEVRPVKCLLDTPSGPVHTDKWMEYTHWKELSQLMTDIVKEYEEQKRNFEVKLNEPKCKSGATIQIGYMFRSLPPCWCSVFFITPREQCSLAIDDSSRELQDKGGSFKGFTQCGEMLVISVILQDTLASITTEATPIPSSSTIHQARLKHRLMKALNSKATRDPSISDYFKESSAATVTSDSSKSFPTSHPEQGSSPTMVKIEMCQEPEATEDRGISGSVASGSSVHNNFTDRTIDTEGVTSTNDIDEESYNKYSVATQPVMLDIGDSSSNPFIEMYTSDRNMTYPYVLYSDNSFIRSDMSLTAGSYMNPDSYTSTVNQVSEIKSDEMMYMYDLYESDPERAPLFQSVKSQHGLSTNNFNCVCSESVNHFIYNNDDFSLCNGVLESQSNGCTSPILNNGISNLQCLSPIADAAVFSHIKEESANSEECAAPNEIYSEITGNTPGNQFDQEEISLQANEIMDSNSYHNLHAATVMQVKDNTLFPSDLLPQDDENRIERMPVIETCFMDPQNYYESNQTNEGNRQMSFQEDLIDTDRKSEKLSETSSISPESNDSDDRSVKRMDKSKNSRNYGERISKEESNQRQDTNYRFVSCAEEKCAENIYEGKTCKAFSHRIKDNISKSLSSRWEENTSSSSCSQNVAVVCQPIPELCAISSEVNRSDYSYESSPPLVLSRQNELQTPLPLATSFSKERLKADETTNMNYSGESSSSASCKNKLLSLGSFRKKYKSSMNQEEPEKQVTSHVYSSDRGAECSENIAEAPKSESKTPKPFSSQNELHNALPDVTSSAAERLNEEATDLTDSGEKSSFTCKSSEEGISEEQSVNVSLWKNSPSLEGSLSDPEDSGVAVSLTPSVPNKEQVGKKRKLYRRKSQRHCHRTSVEDKSVETSEKKFPSVVKNSSMKTKHNLKMLNSPAKQYKSSKKTVSQAKTTSKRKKDETQGPDPQTKNSPVKQYESHKKKVFKTKTTSNRKKDDNIENFLVEFREQCTPVDRNDDVTGTCETQPSQPLQPAKNKKGLQVKKNTNLKKKMYTWLHLDSSAGVNADMVAETVESINFFEKYVKQREKGKKLNLCQKKISDYMSNNSKNSKLKAPEPEKENSEECNTSKELHMEKTNSSLKEKDNDVSTAANEEAKRSTLEEGASPLDESESPTQEEITEKKRPVGKPKKEKTEKGETSKPMAEKRYPKRERKNRINNIDNESDVMWQEFFSDTDEEENASKPLAERRRKSVKRKKGPTSNVNTKSGVNRQTPLTISSAEEEEEEEEREEEESEEVHVIYCENLESLKAAYMRLQCLTKSDLEQRMDENRTYLEDVVNGKVHNQRHQMFVTSIQRLKQQDDYLISGPFSSDQTEHVLHLLSIKLSHLNTMFGSVFDVLTYQCRVLMPTFLTKLVMDNEKISAQRAERLLTKLSINQSITRACQNRSPQE